jgi:hypothetical protein
MIWFEIQYYYWIIECSSTRCLLLKYICYVMLTEDLLKHARSFLIVKSIF